MPCAVSGTITVLRACSPRLRKYAFEISSAASSPCAPAAGLSENAAMPNSELRLRSSSHMIASAPCASSSGANGCKIAQSRQIRHGVVDARVVLHRARAERIEPDVDPERALREPREVPHDVELGVVGQRQVAAQERRAEDTRPRFPYDAGRTDSHGRAGLARKSAAHSSASASCGKFFFPSASGRPRAGRSAARRCRLASSARSRSLGCSRRARDRSARDRGRPRRACAATRQALRRRFRERARRTR